MPAHGLAFFLGTSDGRGIPLWFGKILTIYLRIYSFFLRLKSENKKFLDQQGNKLIFLDHHRKKFLGIPYKLFSFLSFAPSPIGEIGKQIRRGALISGLWVPTHLPLQIIDLGSIVFLCTPGEITTFAGHRLKKTMKKFYPSAIILVWSYCNSYMGYIATPEEYDEQCYEGGHTLYGRNTLNYLIECFELLAQEKLANELPPVFPEDEINLRSYQW